MEIFINLKDIIAMVVIVVISIVIGVFSLIDNTKKK